MTSEGAAVVTFKKKPAKGRPAGLRKRTLADDDAALSVVNGEAGPSSGPSASEVVVKARKAVANPLNQGTGIGGKRRKVTAEAVVSSDSDSEAEGKKFGTSYGAAGSARALANARRSKSPEAKADQPDFLPPDDPLPDDGLYRGAANAKHQLPKGGARFGPVKGPANVRQITLTDYQPDVCKDYKETGFCGFGDTCKFLHDRSDYMHGWQLDSAFAASKSANPKAYMESEEEEEIPFACLLCRSPFTDPVVTKCGHYFCSTCAIKRFTKTPKCFACGAPTGGIFNKAGKILEKMKAKQEAAAKARAAREADESALAGIEGLEDQGGFSAQPADTRPEYGEAEASGSERSFYEDE